MSPAPSRARRLLAAAAGWLVLAATWAWADPATLEPQPLRLQLSEGEVAVTVDDEQERRTDGGTGEDLQQSYFRVQPTVALTFRGSVYHPNLLDFSVRPELGYMWVDKQADSFTNLFSSGRGQESGLIQNYQAMADFLREKPYALHLMAGRSLQDREDDFFSRSQVDTSYYEGRWGYVSGLLPFTLSGRHVDESTRFGDRPYDSSEDVYEFYMSNNRETRGNSSLTLTRRDYQYAEDLYDNDSLWQSANLTDTEVFGRDGRSHLESSITYEQLDQWGRELAAEAVTYRKQEVIRNRIARGLRRAQQRAWVEKKRSYFTPATFTIGNVVNF